MLFFALKFYFVCLENYSIKGGAEVPLHGTHVPGCGGWEGLCDGEGSGGPEGALPGTAVPHRGLQGIRLRD